MRACLRAAGVLLLALAAVPLVAAQDEAKKKTDAKPGVQAGTDDPDAKPAAKAGKGDPDAKPAAKDDAKKGAKAAKKKGDDKDDKTAGKKKDDDKSADKKEKITWGASFPGKLKEMDASSQKNFTVEVQVPVPNPEGIAALTNAQADWQRRRIQILANRNPLQRAQQLAQLQRDMAVSMGRLQAGTIKYQGQEIRLRAAENIRVRTASFPAEYDDKGRLKRPTKEELKELKGPENLPGWTAEFESLRAGQYVQVFLARNQANPAPNAKGAKGVLPKAPKLDDDASLDQQRPEVIMIVIVAEAPRQ